MSLSSKIEELQRRWVAESKRLYALAHDGNRIKPDQSVFAQSVRYWNCADELTPLLELAKEMERELERLRQVDIDRFTGDR